MQPDHSFREEELVDAAEDLGGLLDAVAAGTLDLGPVTQAWILARLDEVTRALNEARGGGLGAAA